MRIRLVFTALLLILTVFAKKNWNKRREIHWSEVYKKFSELADGDFVKDQLEYFAGWKQHLAGTVENTILAGNSF